MQNVGTSIRGRSHLSFFFPRFQISMGPALQYDLQSANWHQLQVGFGATFHRNPITHASKLHRYHPELEAAQTTVNSMLKLALGSLIPHTQWYPHPIHTHKKGKEKKKRNIPLPPPSFSQNRGFYFLCPRFVKATMMFYFCLVPLTDKQGIKVGMGFTKY